MRLAPENSLSVKNVLILLYVLLLKFCIYKPRVQVHIDLQVNMMMCLSSGVSVQKNPGWLGQEMG